MSMLFESDIEFMENTVREIISEWRTTITILSPLPIDQQPNYNKLMREYTGPMRYTQRTIQAERKDIVNNYNNDILQEFNIYGDYEDGIVLYAIPNVITEKDENGTEFTKAYKPNEDDIVIVDGEKYYIRGMRDRIGETLLLIKKYVGGSPDGVPKNKDKDITIPKPEEGEQEESNDKPTPLGVKVGDNNG